jgi:hypothetical protein
MDFAISNPVSEERTVVDPMSNSPTKPAGGKSPEGKILIVVLMIGVMAAIGFRYHLNSDRPQGDPEFYRQKATSDDIPAMEGAMPSAPPI